MSPTVPRMVSASSPCTPQTCSCCSSLLLPQVERLQRKFAMIHSTLAQQQTAKPEADTPKLRASEENPLNMSLRSSLPGGIKVGWGQEACVSSLCALAKQTYCCSDPLGPNALAMCAAGSWHCLTTCPAI